MNEILNPVQADYLKALRKTVSPLLTEMEEFADKYQIPILDPDSAAFLEMLIEIKKPSLALEVGTAIGYSSIRIASRLADDAKLITLEKSPGSYSKASEYISRAALGKKIEVVFGEAFKYITSCQLQFDFIFLDCDKKDYVPFLLPLIGLLKTGGLILADNLLWHSYAALDIEQVPESYKSSTRHVQSFNELFFRQPALETVLLPLGDGLGLGIKK